jgi:hypothetical protein
MASKLLAKAKHDFTLISSGLFDILHLNGLNVLDGVVEASSETTL